MESSKGGDEWRGRQGPDHARPDVRGRTVDFIERRRFKALERRGVECDGT